MIHRFCLIDYVKYKNLIKSFYVIQNENILNQNYNFFLNKNKYHCKKNSMVRDQKNLLRLFLYFYFFFKFSNLDLLKLIKFFV